MIWSVRCLVRRLPGFVAPLGMLGGLIGRIPLLRMKEVEGPLLPFARPKGGFESEERRIQFQRVRGIHSLVGSFHVADVWSFCKWRMIWFASIKWYLCPDFRESWHLPATKLMDWWVVIKVVLFFLGRMTPNNCFFSKQLNIYKTCISYSLMITFHGKFKLHSIGTARSAFYEKENWQSKHFYMLLRERHLPYTSCLITSACMRFACKNST